ncbi:MAG: FAD-linked oxidase C-terminal domain-containing protein [bacterium]|nr:FAD-linked oxidase C-terminal domain-containing protein [bacterium]
MPSPEFDQLAQRLSPTAEIITDLPIDSDYLTDATPNRGSSPALIMAATESDVIEVVSFCHAANRPLVPRGAGTGLSGGCIPLNNALVLSTEKIDHCEINREERMAACGPGLITKQLIDAALAQGLTYLPDPASYEESTLGGNVAENAGGLRCKRFGVTRDYVQGLKAVLPDGKLITTGCYNASHGRTSDSFNLTDLLIGSEGTLAVITEITVELSPIPTPGDTLLVAFDDPADAGQTVTDIVAAGIMTTVLEFLDGDAAACSNEYEKNEGLDRVGAILLIETDNRAKIEQICNNNRASYLRIESDPKKADQLWKIRRNLSLAAKAAAELRLSEDVAVPISRFAELVGWVSQLNRTSKLRINSFGHAGDGNLHVNFMAESDTTINRELITRHVGLLMEKTIALGGTLTGEHGVGLEKKQFLHLEFNPPTLGLMREIKTLFDPACILNPGKLFD